MVKEKKSLLQRIPTWVFLILFLVSASITVYALRDNNKTMVKLRDAVYAADKDNGDVDGALSNLRKHVYSHMNTNLSSSGNAIKPPIQLKYTYERLQAAEQKRVDALNDNIYTDAQNYCQQQNPTDFSGRNRVPCVESYVTEHGEKAKTIPASLYKYDFVSPMWSPDLAGWGLIVSGVLLLTLAASFLLNKLVSSRLKSI